MLLALIVNIQSYSFVGSWQKQEGQIPFSTLTHSSGQYSLHIHKDYNVTATIFNPSFRTQSFIELQFASQLSSGHSKGTVEALVSIKKYDFLIRSYKCQFYHQINIQNQQLRFKLTSSGSQTACRLDLTFSPSSSNSYLFHFLFLTLLSLLALYIAYRLQTHFTNEQKLVIIGFVLMDITFSLPYIFHLGLQQHSLIILVPFLIKLAYSFKLLIIAKPQIKIPDLAIYTLAFCIMIIRIHSCADRRILNFKQAWATDKADSSSFDVSLVFQSDHQPFNLYPLCCQTS